MTTIERKNIGTPDETRTIDKGLLEILTIGDVRFGRATFQPGWRWSECVKPVVKTESCEVHHKSCVLSGRLHVQMDDGTEIDAEAGDLVIIPAGHDAWVLGDEPCVAFDFDDGAKDYAKSA